MHGGSNLSADNRISEVALKGVPKGSTALGFGFRTGESPYVGIPNISSQTNDNKTDLVPIYYYEGKYLYAHGTSFGLHFLDTDRFSFDLVSRYRFDRLEETDDDFYEGISERRQSVDTGLSLKWKNDWGDVSIRALKDTLNRHKGSEADITYEYYWRTGKWLFSPRVSYIFQDSTLTNYYYGVSEEEARQDRPEYAPGKSKFVHVGLSSTYFLNRRMLMFANIGYETIDDSVANSPLVDKKNLTSAYFGFAYNFGNSLNPEEFTGDSTRFGEWSWRINYGYTAQYTFTKLHNGEARKHDDIDTNLAGLTFGKLLKAGRKVDFWGKFSINRRLENGLQDNFFEYNAYIMAMGTGYSPWTDREIFRYGFGFGFSYADKISAVEQFKQKDKNTAHFLNYMEAQVDFPLRNFTKTKSLTDCYIGLTIVHRSGIFANSDFLGNVSGGSDALTAHLECKR
jgi:outer membrane scaffolding protein for murein synthesis (MipA/OmpV family)